MKYVNKVFSWQELANEVTRYWEDKTYELEDHKKLEKEWGLLTIFRNKKFDCEIALEFLKAIVLWNQNLDNRQIVEWIRNNKLLYKETKNFKFKYLEHDQRDEFPIIKLENSFCFVESQEFEALIIFNELFERLYYGQRYLPLELRIAFNFNYDINPNNVLEQVKANLNDEYNWFKKILRIDI